MGHTSKDSHWYMRKLEKLQKCIFSKVTIAYTQLFPIHDPFSLFQNFFYLPYTSLSLKLIYSDYQRTKLCLLCGG